MKLTFQYIFFFVVISFAQLLNAQNVGLQWGYSLGSSSSIGYSTLVDSVGNVYNMGTFFGTMDVDPGEGVFNVSSSSVASYTDTYIQKVSAQGDLLWIKTINSRYPKQMAIDDAGHIYLTGNFSGILSYQSNGVLDTITGNLNADIYLFKLDSLGDIIWAKNFGGLDESMVLNLSIQGDTSIYLCGGFGGTVDFDPGVGIVNKVSNGDMDAFVLKLDSAGNFQWVNAIGGAHLDQAYCMTFDEQGMLYVSGNYHDTVDLDPGLGVSIYIAHPDPVGVDVHFAVFIQKFSPGGTLQWVKSFGENGLAYVNGICADNFGNLFLIGGYTDTVDFDPGTGVSNLIINWSWRYGHFILKLDTAGSYKNVGGYSLGSGSPLRAMTLFSDSLGNIYFTKPHFNCPHCQKRDFDPGPGVYVMPAYGNRDIVVQKIDSSLNLVWATRIGGLNEDEPYSLALTPELDIVITGSFRDSMDIDPSSRTRMMSSIAGSSGGGRNAFVIKFVECSTSFATDTIVSCDSVTWRNGITYGPGVFSAFDTIANSRGCDSIITLNLTVNLNHTLDVRTACDSLTWRDGVTYYQSNNTAQDTLTNIFGCDSIIILNLSILSNNITETIRACDSLTWIDGITYYSNNNLASLTFTNVMGCDSVIKLDLTINPTLYGTDIQMVCDSLTWVDGQTYYTDNNVATYNYISTTGCDSVVTLDLTILVPAIRIDTIAACYRYKWVDNWFYFQSNNTATHIITGGASNGCDSIVYLNLEILQPTLGIDTQLVCDSLTWIDGITYFTNNNLATYTLSNVVGCDSVITLDLTVLSDSTIDIINACDSVVWLDGMSYYANNNSAFVMYTNTNGCDSTVYLDLTISNASYGVDEISICDSLLWLDGITYYNSNNTATHTLVNAMGCDSLVILDLTILVPTYGTHVISACSTYTWNGFTYISSNNTAKDTLVNTVGCDSIITLNLTILSSTSFTDVVNVCDSLTWMDGITYTSSTIVPTYIITNTAGCDSVITLNLTINDVDTSVITQDLTLSAQASNATYRWLDCLNNNQPMANQTTNVFKVTKSGNYAVEVTQNGCVDTSACFEFINVGIAEMELMGISLYPNPTSDILHIDKGTNQILDIVITNGAGAEVFRTTSNNQITLIDMSQYASGIYVVSMQNQDGVKIEQVVKR